MGSDFLLVRHAHTAQTGPDAKQWSLSARGWAVATQLAAWAGWREVAALVTSDEAKAIETGAAVGAAHPHLRVVPPVAGLAEVDRRGVYVDAYEGAVAAFFAHPAVSPHGWEPACDALCRFTAAVESVLAAHPHETVAVVAHGLVFALYQSTLIGGPALSLECWRSIPFAAVARVGREPDGSRVLRHPFVQPTTQHNST